MPSRPAVPSRIEDYAIIGDGQTAALVSRTGSLDWLCLPRFDSGACFAALLGDEKNGHWRIAPRRPPRRTRRSYREDTLVLDTTFEDGDGEVTVTDCMPMRDRYPEVVRVVHGVRGRMRMRTELIIRFDYGCVVPWVRKVGETLLAVAGPDSLYVRSGVPLRGEGLTTVAEFDVSAGQTIDFSLSWRPSHLASPGTIPKPADVVKEALGHWRGWASVCTYEGEWRSLVRRSLVTLAALRHTQTGGIVAAPTTSLPEAFGGTRNWDYRYCWPHLGPLVTPCVNFNVRSENGAGNASPLSRALLASHPSTSYVPREEGEHAARGTDGGSARHVVVG